MADDFASASGIIRSISAIAQTVAIIGGGIWAYFKFSKGRTFRPRLEPTVSGRVFMRDGFVYLLAKANLKNVGASRVDLKQEGTGLRILAASVDEPEIILLSTWHSMGSLSDEHLMVIRNNDWIALRLELQVHSEAVLWHAMTIAELSSYQQPHLDENGLNTLSNQRSSK